MTEGARRPAVPQACVRAVRVGHGGNCSSVGSVIDTLFVSAAAGGALLAAICAAMQDEPITVIASPGANADADADTKEDEA